MKLQGTQVSVPSRQSLVGLIGKPTTPPDMLLQSQKHISQVLASVALWSECPNRSHLPKATGTIPQLSYLNLSTPRGRVPKKPHET